MALKHEQLSFGVIGAAMAVHSHFRNGYVENVYERAPQHELNERGFEVRRQVPIPVNYKGVEVGNYIVDLLVNELWIVELKTVRRLTSVHVAQVLNYLAANDSDLALLLNFGARSLQFKRIVR